ncbi:hypothetical protein ETU08_00150 [Apibacter muscae]|uniref:hypothetical protein n=1 Tax=Apibacter muscae TaxID=2509004 RepID=UPI0011ADD75A|nr:hypothetical protein [Apibacter muscae]TWP31905.1 hypothetical protein ETU08_00150 [Apibacter muscae]
MYFKAIIRVVKSIRGDFGATEILREPLIDAENKQEVKEILLKKYPQFFQNNKIYERESKDTAQFFYVVIYPLLKYELDQIKEGSWECSYCGQIHKNKYEFKPKYDYLLLGENKMFCRSEGNICMENFKKEKFKGLDMLPFEEYYINKDSANYIYKCTHKYTGKCYIGKTKNIPFFRWYNHLTYSYSPFGLFLKSTTLDQWTFEVLEVLPSNMTDTEVFKKESEYILKYDSINNGFNEILSYKK